VDIPASVIEPASAHAERSYRIAFRDDDWDHWTSPEQMATYLGVREPTSGRWQVSSLDGTPVDWTYDDDEIAVLGQP
jgi:hypothetical protein